MKTEGKTGTRLLVLLLVAALAATAGCGKKGPPTMRSFEQPDRVAEVKATHRDGRINLSWAYNAKQGHIVVSGIFLLRAEGKGPYKAVAKLPASAKGYSDADIAPDREYRYKLRVFSARYVESEDSAELTVRPVKPPETPSDVSYRIAGNEVLIKWKKGGKGTLFNIYRSEKKGAYAAAPVNEKPLESPFFRDSLNMKAPVYYVVVAVKRTDIPNESAVSEELVIDPATFTPAPPADLRYVRSGGRGYLTWKDSEEPYVKGYRVYRKGTHGGYEFIGEVNVPVYLDEDKVSDMTLYRVTAVGPLKESSPSAEVGARRAGE
jgi:predicted small lipoprotein YifL